MKLPKKTKKCFTSDIPGALIIARETGRIYVKVTSAVFGVKKEKGCVYFEVGSIHDYLLLTKPDCRAAYFDCPKAGEAWLVVPKSWGYEWTRIDGEIDFS